jgi:hypothetical protein
MKLQGRNLEPNLRGGDVELLQEELRQLGFEIADSEGFFGSTTFLAIQQFQREHRIDPVTGIVDEVTARIINRAVSEIDVQTWVVLGQVQQEDQNPVAGITVRVFNKGLRKENLLGQAVTDEQGKFEVAYTPEYRSDKSRWCLILRAFDSAATEVAASEIVFDPKPFETVDLLIGEMLRGQSEFNELEHKLGSYLTEEEIHPADVTIEEARYLVRKLGLPIEQVEAYVSAARLGRETGLRIDALYAFSRQNLPTRLPALLGQSPEVLREALERALADNLVPPGLRDEIERTVDRMQELIVQHTFTEPDVTDKFSLNDLFDTTVLSQAQRRKLLDRYVRREGSVEEFWEALRQDPEFGEKRVEEAQLALHLGAVTYNHLPLIRELKRDPGIKTMRDLARLDERDWLELIRRPGSNRGVIGTPPEVPGEDDATREESYAEVISAIVEDAFPTAFFAHRLAEDNQVEIPGKRDLDTFFHSNPDFTFERTGADIDEYLREHASTALAGVADEEVLRKNLKDMKRLFAITPSHRRHRVMKPLLEEGITSARAIERMGSGFMTQFAGLIGEDQARMVLGNAVERSALAQTLFAEFSPAMLYGTPAAVLSLDEAAGPPTVPGIPNWATLFGSLTLCACEHCDSVLGPAAYLVDILAFLKGHGVLSGLMMNSRRGDLGRIELSCRNANTPLPYIDLVNEILENAVSTTGQTNQTTGTAEELRAVPEHRNDAAYSELAGAVYPWSLPFGLPHEEARHYLGHLGIPRYRLMETFQQEEGEPTAAAIAADHLGLTPTDRAIITGAPLDPERTLMDFWGRSGQFVNVSALRSHVSRVSNFIAQSGLRYEEVQALLGTRFINPQGNIDIRFEALDCDLTRAHITPTLSTVSLDAIHRFERLRRKLGWSFYDLDRAITALQPGALNDALLVHLSDVERLRAMLKVPLTTLLSWWATLDTASYEVEAGPSSLSLYHELFQNKVVFDEEELSLFELNSAGTELISSDQDLRDHLPSLAAALKVATHDILRITPGLSPRLNLQNLSRLYRTVSLAKALKLPIREFLALRALTETDPFVSPGRTRRFVDLVAKVRETGFVTHELEYLLWHIELSGVKVSPPVATTALLLSELRNGLLKIHDETLALPDPNGELTRKYLDIARPILGWEDGDVEKASALLDGSAEYVTALDALGSIDFPPQTRIAYDELNQELSFIGVMTQQEREDLLGLSPDAAYQAAIQALFDEPRAFVSSRLAVFVDPIDFTAAFLDLPTTRERKFDHIMPVLSAFLRRVLSEGFVTQQLATALQLEAEVAQLLLLDAVHSPVDPNLTAMSVFLALAEDDVVLALEEFGEAFSDQFRTFILLHKVGMIVSKLGITARELKWLFDHSARLDLLDFNALPSTAPAMEVLPSLFPSFERLIDLLRLRDLPTGDPHVFDLLDIALAFDPQTGDTSDATMEFLNAVHQRTGWNLQDLRFLTGLDSEPDGAPGFALSFPENYADGHALRRFQDCFRAIKLLGMSAMEIAQWIVPELSAQTARSVKAAAQAKYEPAQWLRIAQAINDMLREQQRDALVAFMIAHRGFRNVAHLYGRFLIDPEMSACMMTSRIVQASASVQLYVQRILLNLEPGVSLDSAAAEEWEWMNHYRVWEANRKVFLYPENWIDPSLLKDESHLFKELKNSMLQGEVTDDTVEAAIATYLAGLNEIARLEISAVYQDRDTDVLHVFGRTRGQPHRYFYRRRLRAGDWTAWEPVELDIEGDHLVPFVKNERLYLCWPVFTENTGTHQTTRLEVGLAWSELKNGAWSAQKMSKDILRTGISTKEALLACHFRVITKIVQDPRRFQSDPVIFLRIRVGELLPNRITVGTFRLRDDDSVQVSSSYSEFTREYADPPSSIPFEPSAIRFEAEFDISFSEPVLPRSQMHFMAYQEHGNPVGSLQVPTGQVDRIGNYNQQTANNILVLRNTPGRFRIAYPHQFNRFVTQAPFFFEDDTHSYLVQTRTPYSPAAPIGESIGQNLLFGPVSTHGGVAPDHVDRVFPVYATLLHRAGSTGADDSLAPSDSLDAGSPMEPLLFPRYTFLPSALQLDKRFRFHSHSHPHATRFVERLNQRGIAGLLGNLGMQSTGSANFFINRYDPNPHAVELPHPVQDVDFSFTGAYSLYNWELFFHAPLLVAESLRQNQRFEEALRWLNFIFNPMDRSSGKAPQRFWKVRPFSEYDLSDPESRPVQELLKALSEGNYELSKQVSVWRSNPFSPHAIARLRPIAYQKRVVMAYLDCLIGWANQLFRLDTLESINKAIQLYLLAAEILGPRPTEIPPRERPPALTFNELEPQLDAFSNALIEIELKLPAGSGLAFGSGLVWDTAGSPGSSPPPLGTTLYFCIPRNDKLLGYWSEVEKRLFQIRHCMNIEGVVRDLPLFAPPIDPALLVQAVAAGLDIGSALNNLNAPLPHYRFQAMAQKATELCNDVKTLGAALLSALEKKDAETLSLLRSRHEVDLLQLVRQSRERQVDEAREALESLRRSRDVIQTRRDYYENIPQRIPHEDEQLSEMEAARTAEAQSQLMDLAASTIANFTPDVTASVSMGLNAGVSAGINYGRANVIGFLQFLSSKRRFDAAQHSSEANLASILGGWERRSDEWRFQADVAAKELLQIDKQITAAEIRRQIAEKELESHNRQIENAKEADAFMRSKYTNQQLYNWMISQISAVYFQSYQLAYDTAKRAEKAFQYELGDSGVSFIKFGYWDSLKKGLLAGERLYLDLKRMEVGYLEQNKREYELTKHISLGMLDPLALAMLRETGQCFVNLPEEIFDLDDPNHYMRRIESISLTMPCVTGPYTSVSCTLTLLGNRIRTDNNATQDYGYTGPEDARFRHNVGAIQSIATSSGQQDSGLFEFSFRDERYLPFEGAGVISDWRLELPSAFRQFDYGTISDVVIHVNYTAREGGALCGHWWKMACASSLIRWLWQSAAPGYSERSNSNTSSRMNGIN